MYVLITFDCLFDECTIIRFCRDLSTEAGGLPLEPPGLMSARYIAKLAPEAAEIRCAVSAFDLRRSPIYFYLENDLILHWRRVSQSILLLDCKPIMNTPSLFFLLL